MEKTKDFDTLLGERGIGLSGKHDDLLKLNGRYAELYHMQFKDVLKQNIPTPYHFKIQSGDLLLNNVINTHIPFYSYQ